MTVLHKVDDMILTKSQYNLIYPDENDSGYQNAILDVSELEKKWPNGEVPYQISENFTKTEWIAITEVIDEFNHLFEGYVNFR